MSRCENCEDLRYTIGNLRDVIEELRDELRKERKKTEDYDSVKHKRDELQQNVNRSYDNYITDPMRRSHEL